MQSFIIPADETSEQAEARKRQMVARALANPPADVGQGIASIGDALAYRQQQQSKMFPAAPGGAKPSFMTAIQNMFGGSKGGFF